jgi:gamma-glutamylcyclotransferase (GGCT)/AIG2-like uncharacterized protein YtfP
MNGSASGRFFVAMRLELRLFVYGTLKSGFPNYDSYCTGAAGVYPAHLRGKLFKLSAQIPVMELPRQDILAYGTADVLADIETQEDFESLLPTGETSRTFRSEDGEDWRTIRGELFIFGDPLARLPLIDRLEEFFPGRPSTYLRALVFVTMADGHKTCAWTYIAGFDTGSLEEYPEESWVQPR